MQGDSLVWFKNRSAGLSLIYSEFFLRSFKNAQEYQYIDR